MIRQQLEPNRVNQSFHLKKHKLVLMYFYKMLKKHHKEALLNNVHVVSQRIKTKPHYTTPKNGTVKGKRIVQINVYDRYEV